MVHLILDLFDVVGSPEALLEVEFGIATSTLHSLSVKFLIFKILAVVV